MNTGRPVQQVIESDRAQLAHEIHDELIPLLFASRSAVESLAACASTPADEKATLEQTARWLHDAMTLCRGLLHNAHLPDLRSGNWANHVECLVMRLHPEVRVHWAWLTTRPDVPESVLVALYRITVEAVRNAIRHSGADEILVSDRWRPDGSYTVTIEDDGHGFDPGAVSPDRFGLRGIRQRGELAGLDVRIESKIGGPTKIRLKVPAGTSTAGE